MDCLKSKKGVITRLIQTMVFFLGGDCKRRDDEMDMSSAKIYKVQKIESP
jgi:hypothetical protein